LSPETPAPDLQALLDEGRCLAMGAADEPAKQAYLNALRRDPTCLEALTQLARLALRSGHRSAARTAYQQAVLCHPGDAAARVNLASLLIETGEFEAARALLVDALALAPDLAPAHQTLARVLTALGETDAAAAHWARGFETGWLAPQPYYGPGDGAPLLLLVSTQGGNIPVRGLLDDTVFAVTALYAEHFDPAAPLPPHAVVFNAIGDADRCGLALEKARQIAARSGAPLVNPPDRVALTTRLASAARLAGLPDVAAPAMRLFGRDELLAASDLAFPVLVRSPGYHTGQHFVRVERREELAAAIADLPGEALLAIEPFDVAGADGLHRKHRVMLIGGELFPLHLAVSSHWKVHYFSADMAGDAGLRAEEAAFLEDMPAVLGPRAMAGLRQVAATLGLDYAGVDFAVAPDGRLVVFEANPGMVIQLPGPEPIWDYRRAPIQRALDAVKALLLTKAALPELEMPPK
jgi:hypothetical protein